MWILKENGINIFNSDIWEPRQFGKLTNTSFPISVGLNYVWSNGAFSITYTPKTDTENLTSVKNKRLYQITHDRNTSISQPVIVHGRPWQADAESQRNLANEILTTQAGVPMSPIWRDADNNNMVLTDIQQLVDIAAAFKVQTLTAYLTSWTRKEAVEAATTVEDVLLA